MYLSIDLSISPAAFHSDQDSSHKSHPTNSGLSPVASLLTMQDQSRLQDVMGQYPQLKTYNHGTALFPLRDDTSREAVTEAIEAAAAKIAAKIPWLAEQVVHTGKTEGYTGNYGLAPWPSDAPPNTLVRVKDCSDICPSHDEILKAKGPAFMFNGAEICPVPGFPMTYDEAKIGPAPAVIIQLNHIKGGYLLTFSNQHNVMDGTGMFQVIGLLATVMSGGDISPSAIEQGNRDRKTVIPLFDPNEKMRDHSHLLAPVPSQTPSPPPTPPKAPATWNYFRFLKTSIPKIKAMATDPQGYDSSVPFISSNDAVSAFYWKRLATNRVLNGQDPTAMSKFSRAIDSRTAMGISTEYMGQMVYFSATWLSFQELVDLPLSTIASKMRKNLNEVNNEWSVRSYATFIAGIPDKTKLLYGGPFNRFTDIASSSMAQASLVLKFGILGEPELIRRPNLAPIPGTLYFYPPEASGDLNLLVCLGQQDLEAMKTDAEWGPCVDFIG